MNPIEGDFQAGGTVIQTLTVLFSTGVAAPFSFEFFENRPIDSDSGRSKPSKIRIAQISL
jgi:hypothetical protein